MIISSADKESCTAIMKKIDYVQKLNHMIEEGTQHARSTETDYTACSDLERLQDFIHRHLRIQNIMIRCAKYQIKFVFFFKKINYKKKKKKKKQKMKFPELLKDANNDDDNYENISS